MNASASWVGWGAVWIAAENAVELTVTPRRLLKELITIDETTGLPTEDTGIRLFLSNDDGSDLAMIPFEFIHRAPKK